MEEDKVEMAGDLEAGAGAPSSAIAADSAVGRSRGNDSIRAGIIAPLGQTSAPKVAEETSQISNTEIKEFSLSPIRTYRGDIASVVENRKISGADVALAEEKRRLAIVQKKIAAPVLITSDKTESRKHIFKIVAISLGAMMIVSFAVAIFLYVASRPVTPIATIKGPESLIFAELSKEMALGASPNRDFLVNSLTEKIKENIPINSVENVYFTSDGTSVNAPAFLRLISPRAPFGLLRTVGTQFMYGIHSYNGNEGFLILQTDTYDTAKAGMIEWENRIPAELFQSVTGKIAPQDIDVSWQNGVIKNVEVRIMIDRAGKKLLYYGFANKNIILISAGESSFSEVIARFNTPRPAEAN